MSESEAANTFAELTTLKLKRDQVKAQITRFKTFLNNLSEDFDALEIEHRLKTIERDALNNFNEIQEQIELIEGKIQEIERENFENSYYRAITDAKKEISNRSKANHQSNINNTENIHSYIGSENVQGRVKLPRLNLPEFHGRALLDSGSMSNFITHELARNLNLNQIQVDIPVAGINNSKNSISNAIVTNVFSTDRNYESTEEFLIVNQITSMIPTNSINLTNVQVPKDNTDSEETSCNVSISNEQLHNQMKKFWSIEKVRHCKILSSEEAECEQHFLNTFTRNENGRFEVSLPFRENVNELGDSREAALTRFKMLERKLQINIHLKRDYQNFLTEYELLGHMTEINPVNDVASHKHYLPHHGVVKETSTTTKLRVVFDASAKTSSGLSLDNVLKVGPLIQRDLTAIVLNFRMHNVVFTADMEKMYRQINIAEGDRSYQRIFWRKEPSDTLKEYKLNTVTYGAAPASFLAVRALHQAAIEAASSYPEASRVIIEDFYMDDLISGADTIEQARTLKLQIKEVFREACFPLRKWCTDRPELLESRGCENTQSYIIPDDESFKTLGLYWDPKADSLNYFVNLEIQQKVTKRVVLSTMSKIFDPLGLISLIVVTIRQLFKSELWWYGPEFLLKNSEHWPSSKSLTSTTLNDSQERRKPIQLSFTSCDDTFIFDKFSNFTKLHRVMAFVLRFINNAKKGKEEKITGDLTPNELKMSLNKLVKLCQSSAFATERNCLLQSRPLPKTSNLLSLNPLIDYEGLLRVGGRIRNSLEHYGRKHPILLPSEHKFTQRIIEYEHIRHLHAGPQLVLAAVRNKFWPINGKSTTRKIIYKCVKCFKTRPTCTFPKMADLPKERLIPTRPFSSVGIDFAGPVHIKASLARTQKLVKAYERDIRDFLLQNEISWSFIPPKAPHFGGLWEANIKCIKTHLMKVVGNAHLTYEQLATILCQIEGILNSRPLTQLSCDPNDFSAITPAHFLIGDRLMALPDPNTDVDTPLNRLKIKEPSDTLKEYKLNTVTYGAAPASFLAVRALHQAAIEAASSYPEASRVIIEDFYMDDLISGADTIEQARTLKLQIKEVFREACFPLRKWCTDRPELLESRGCENTQSYIIPDDESFKTLGLYWDPKADSLNYFVNLEIQQKVTKRVVLSTMSKIFDPLGLISLIVVTIRQLFKSELWWYGPEFLLKNSEHWPSSKSLTSTTLNDSQERRKPIQLSFTSCDDTFIFDKFSNFTKLHRVMAFVLRFINNAKKGKEEKITGDLTPNELKMSLNKLVKLCQSSAFATERNCLLQSRPLPKTSNLLSLNPLIDYEGLLRVGGRIRNSLEHYGRKHPILLPSEHKFTQRIIEYEHIRHLHAGPQLVLAAVRNKFWPINGKSTTRKIIYKCVKCFKTRPTCTFPKMADLPKERLIPTRPFSSVGIDFAGPVHIKASLARTQKLVKAYERDIRDFLLQNEISWSFIPPKAPHFGGLWEANIKCIKTHLMKVVGNAHLTYEQLATILCQIEGILNSRPLTQLSCDPNDFSAITPAHFLIGDRLMALPDPNTDVDTPLNRLKIMSTLLKWAQNTTQSKLNSKNNSANGERKWIHPPETLQKGHIAYLVKFLGNTVVDQPKGIEVVKEAIRKLRFSQQLRKSESGAKTRKVELTISIDGVAIQEPRTHNILESGAKTRKVELTISIDGVAIQEPRTHNILHQFPLHRISYCADDKGEKKFFSFIAKQPNQVDNEQEDSHECFVFISDKLAEEITLTIGQAFELAYKRFLETSGKDLETQKRAIITQQKIKRLEQENNIYKQRLLEIAQFNSIKQELDQYLRRNDIKNVIEIQSSGSVSSNSSSASVKTEHMNGSTPAITGKLLDFSNNHSENTNGNAPPVPPRNFENTPAVGTKLEGLLLNEFDQDNDFDPRSFETNTAVQPFITTNGNPSSPPLLAPPPKAPRRTNLSVAINNNNEHVPKLTNQDLFGSTPFSNVSTVTNTTPNSAKILDPFEMGDFATVATSQDIENAIGLLDKRILEMKTGFSRGISFGNDDFSLESLDPLKN
ncbi:Phosphotyrosine interaction domain (PTB/PID) [Popillia japonica]|uniref:Phosphotyrosine interaction domain (PTB/PID) n=1 Tax=Popillia japonica TaxID=7064 RepID=A0AAW1L5U7_POPJA